MAAHLAVERVDARRGPAHTAVDLIENRRLVRQVRHAAERTKSLVRAFELPANRWPAAPLS
jgi:hypothetical protein